MASAIKPIIGIRCPKCNFVMKTYRPSKAGVFKLVCPKCKQPVYVKLPKLAGISVMTRSEYETKKVEKTKDAANENLAVVDPD